MSKRRRWVIFGAIDRETALDTGGFPEFSARR
jgi:hypothetical protein